MFFIYLLLILFKKKKLHKRHENFSFFMFKDGTRSKDIWKVLFMCIVLFSCFHLQRMHKSHEYFKDLFMRIVLCVLFFCTCNECTRAMDNGKDYLCVFFSFFAYAT